MNIKIIDNGYRDVDFDEIKKENFEPQIYHQLYKEIFNEPSYCYSDCKINENDIVVDLGANIGLFTIYANQFKPSKIYAFEANSDNYECLVENSQDNVEPYHFAVSNKVGEIDFYNTDNIGGHTILNMDRGDMAVSTPCIDMNYIFENYLESIDFLKMDIEGGEKDVINGIKDILFNKINKISMEYHHGMLDKTSPFFYKKMIIRLSRFYKNNHIIECGAQSLLFFWK